MSKTSGKEHTKSSRFATRNLLFFRFFFFGRYRPVGDVAAVPKQLFTKNKKQSIPRVPVSMIRFASLCSLSRSKRQVLRPVLQSGPAEPGGDCVGKQVHVLVCNEIMLFQTDIYIYMIVTYRCIHVRATGNSCTCALCA